MGLVTHLGNYIKNLATISEPLRVLIRKNTKWQWNASENQAFEDIKDKICNDIREQAYYSVNLPTKLYTDASGVGLGAILIQVQEGVDRVVAYASKSLTDTEKRYPQSQRESLAIVWAIERFSHFLLGKHFELYTDNKASEYLFGRKERTSTRAITRAEGWALRLSMYSFDVKAVKGKDNIADTLSRLCKPGDEAYEEPNKNEEFASIKLKINNLSFKEVLETSHREDQTSFSNNKVTVNALYNSQETIPWSSIEEESGNDENIKQVGKALKSGNWNEAPASYEKLKDELYMKGKALIRGLQIVLPTKLRARALDIVHLNHAGEAAMKRTLRDRVWWPGLDKDVEQKRRECKACTQIGPKDPPPPMTRTSLPDKPWEYLAIDFFSASECDAKVLSVTDYYSRYLACLIVQNETAEKTIEALDKLFHRLGYPRVIKSDNGSPFQSRDFNDYCEKKNIKLVHSIAYFPQQNGMSERSMQVIKKGIKIARIENRNWKLAVRNVEAAYNATTHAVTLKTPNEMLFQRKVRGGLPTIETDEDFNDSITRTRDKEFKDKGKTSEDKARRARETNLEIGDSVLVENLNPLHKLVPRFGPEVLKVIEINGPKIAMTGQGKARVERHSTQVKKWLKEPERSLEENKEKTAKKKQLSEILEKNYETRSKKAKTN